MSDILIPLLDQHPAPRATDRSLRGVEGERPAAPSSPRVEDEEDAAGIASKAGRYGSAFRRRLVQMVMSSA
ncbi:hypothetical protein, partial [Streptomyces sp. SS]|uniref:hypothetical protein n=1 Tax=Streptomyces sp. SS TaxID=260742 RepID=UPI001ED9C2AB